MRYASRFLLSLVGIGLLLPAIGCSTDLIKQCEKIGIGSDCVPENTGSWFKPPQGVGPAGLNLSPTSAKIESGKDELKADLSQAIAAGDVTVRQIDSVDRIAISRLFTYEVSNQPQSCVAEDQASDFAELILSKDQSGALKYLIPGPSYIYQLDVSDSFAAKFEAEFKADASAKLNALGQAKADAVLEAVHTLAKEAQSKSVSVGVIRYVYPQQPDYFRPKFAAMASHACKEGARNITDGMVYAVIGTFENVSIKGSRMTMQDKLEASITDLKLDSQAVAALKASVSGAIRASISSEWSETLVSRLEGGVFIPLKVRRDVYFKEGSSTSVPSPGPLEQREVSKACTFDLDAPGEGASIHVKGSGMMHATIVALQTGNLVSMDLHSSREDGSGDLTETLLGRQVNDVFNFERGGRLYLCTKEPNSGPGCHASPSKEGDGLARLRTAQGTVTLKLTCD